MICRRVRAQLVRAAQPGWQEALLNELNEHIPLDQLVSLARACPTDIRLEVFFELHPQIHAAVQEALR